MIESSRAALPQELTYFVMKRSGPPRRKSGGMRKAHRSSRIRLSLFSLWPVLASIRRNVLVLLAAFALGPALALPASVHPGHDKEAPPVTAALPRTEAHGEAFEIVEMRDRAAC